MRDDPISAAQDLPRDLGVAALVGIEQWAQRQGREPQYDDERGQAEIGSAFLRARDSVALHVKPPRLAPAPRVTPTAPAPRPESRRVSAMAAVSQAHEWPTMRVTVAPASHHFISKDSNASRSSIPSSSACRVNTCKLRSAAVAVRRNTVSAIFVSSIRSRPGAPTAPGVVWPFAARPFVGRPGAPRPISSSKVGKVVGICGHELAPSASSG